MVRQDVEVLWSDLENCGGCIKDLATRLVDTENGLLSAYLSCRENPDTKYLRSAYACGLRYSQVASFLEERVEERATRFAYLYESLCAQRSLDPTWRMRAFVAETEMTLYRSIAQTHIRGIRVLTEKLRVCVDKQSA